MEEINKDDPTLMDSEAAQKTAADKTAFDASEAAQAIVDGHALLGSLTMHQAQSLGITNGMPFEEQVRRALTLSR